MSRSWIRVSGDIRIDIDDIDDADIKLILTKAQERGLVGFHYDRDYAERALEALLRKRYADATALLDRALYPFPKKDVTDAYMKGLARGDEVGK